MHFKIFILVGATFIGIFSCSPSEQEQRENELMNNADTLLLDKIEPMSTIVLPPTKSDYDPSLNSINREMFDLYEPFVRPEYLNIQQIHGSADGIQDVVIYLGIIKDLDFPDEFHIVSKYTSITTADSKKGNSQVAFVNIKRKYARVYFLNEQKELPIAIEDNVLIFGYGGIKRGIQISGGLPEMLCVPGSGCYE
jgi:hypothetical protein